MSLAEEGLPGAAATPGGAPPEEGQDKEQIDRKTNSTAVSAAEQTTWQVLVDTMQRRYIYIYIEKLSLTAVSLEGGRQLLFFPP